MSEETKAEKAARNRRDWVKNAAIVFLALMLVLTLFSNTFMNYSLPEVSTQYVVPGTITSRVRGTGTISASDPYSVVLNESRVVASVPVRSGDTVEKGDVILVLEESESEELKAAEKQLEELISAYESSIIASGIPAEDVYAAQNGTGGAFSENLARLSELEAQIEAARDQITDCETKMLAAQRDRDAMAKSLGVEYSDEYIQMIKSQMSSYQQMENNYDTYVAAYDAAVAAWEQAKADLAAAQGIASEDELAQLEQSVLTTEEEMNAAKDAKETAANAGAKIGFWKQALKMEDYTNQITQLENIKTDAEASIATLNEECADLRESSGNIQGLQSQLKAIEEQRVHVEELRSKAAAAEVTAPVSGTITSISYRAGEKIEAGSTVATIQIAGKECTMTISVTSDQARSLSVGDVADIQNAWYYSDVTATISSIRVDPGNPQTNKLIVFSVEGEVMDGQSLSVSAGQKSAEYSLTVPNSAVREDNNGKFILIVEYKSSPLGTRYVATRVDVEVLASDEKNSAITGALNGYEYVITTASKPVAPGQLIRLTE